MVNSQISKVAVIGLGLIGGSLARALRNYTTIEKIIGIDLEEIYGQQALQINVIDEFYKVPSPDALKDCDIIFLCVPIHRIVDMIKNLYDFIPKHCIITDVGSSKHQIVEQVEALFPELNFIGGHPMAGSEKSGFDASSKDLFQNAYYILTPSKHTSEESILTLETLIVLLQARPIICEPEVHDFCVAGISHFPHVCASLLVNLIHGQDQKELMHKIAATGFKDSTRIAASNPTLWQQIVLQNKENILYFVRNYQQMLTSFETHLIEEDTEWLYNFFDSSSKFRNTFK